MNEPTVTNSYQREKPIQTKDEWMSIMNIPITIAQWIERLHLPSLISTFGLCIIMFWIGAFKFTPTESRQIMVYVEHSPFTSWMYHFFSIQTASDIIGITEIIAATGILLGTRRPFIGLLGSLLAVVCSEVHLAARVNRKQCGRQAERADCPQFIGRRGTKSFNRP